MIGIVVVTHGRLADELVAATEHVVGPLEACTSISIGPDDDMERRREDIRQAVEEADSGSGVIILTDMFGGTPSNLSISLLDKGKVEVVAGANLPMLIKLAEARTGLPSMSWPSAPPKRASAISPSRLTFSTPRDLGAHRHPLQSARAARPSVSALCLRGRKI
jgi:PTS system mannose-specific IIA component